MNSECVEIGFCLSRKSGGGVLAVCGGGFLLLDFLKLAIGISISV